MKKKALIVTVGILFVVLLGTIFIGTTRYSCTSMEKLFANDKLLFHNAAETLLDHPCDGGIRIRKEDPQNELVTVVQVGELFIETEGATFSSDINEEIYAAVAPLFEKNYVTGIAGGSGQIHFAINSYMGEESSIVFSTNNKPRGSFPTLIEQKKLEENWYAIICQD